MPGSKSSGNHTLPLPVNQKTRFVSPGRTQLRVRWAKIKRQLGNGSAPDDSLGDPTMTETTNSDSGSVFNRKHNAYGAGVDGVETSDVVDEVVVDNPANPQYWTKPLTGTGLSDHAGGSHTSPGGGTAQLMGTNYQSEASSMRNTAFESSGPISSVVNFFRWRTWPVVKHFFNPAYHDKVLEEAYQKELWFTQKSTHIFGACFFVFNWVLSVALLPRPWSNWNKIVNYALAPALSIPLVVMACFDFPRKRAWIWQIWLWCVIWLFSAANVIDMKLCDYYVPAQKHCGNKDFQGTLYYVSALPIIGLFAAGQTRLFTFFTSCAWIILVGATILSIRISYIRNVLNIGLFHGFVLLTHYRRDLADRRMYTMRAELKVQFRSRQKAQINERKTMDSKRRFSSYIFHEVRVPLNSSLLAVQNLEAAGVFDKNSDLAVEYQALSGSLSMMSQVLNDVLDFTRMEKGGFSSVSRPMALHTVFRSIFMPLRLDANARGLTLETSLDSRIDDVAREAAYTEEELLDDGVREADGVVMGDEMRLRQVVNNLATNACKFTAAGGTITITTELIYPVPELKSGDRGRSSTDESGSTSPGKMIRSLSSDTTSATGATYSPRLSANRLQEHEAKEGTQPKEVVVVRIEIKDTGVGIRPRDMAENRLFSAYVQTEIGRNQGGKGTGLGLSLVRQIVMLSGGRLGVKSRAGEGSTFWVEMPFIVGPQTRTSDGLDMPRPLSPPSSSSKGTKSSPLSDQTSHASSDFQFMPAIRRKSGDAVLNMGSIVESTPPGAGIELIPTHFRFISPPSTPDGGHPPPSILTQPAIYPVNEAVPVPAASSTLNASTMAALLKRPENKPHMSSSSAPPAVSPATQNVKSQAMEFADGPVRVLVVDDDNLTRTLMSRMLARLGCTVSTAENGAIALEMLLASEPGVEQEAGPAGIDPRSLRRKNYDITFLDNQMPVKSGLEVVHRLRSLARDDLVIGVTANALLSDQDQYIEAGASAVLTKPVLEKDLRRYLIMADNLRSQAKDPKFWDTFKKPAFPPPLLLRTDSDG